MIILPKLERSKKPMLSDFAKEIREELAQEAETPQIPLKPKAETSESRCYTVPELQVILNISRGSVYELLQRKEFKWFQIGNGRYRISKKSFDQWLDGLS